MVHENNRFSVYLLEKDVLEYVNAKNKYNEYDEKYSVCDSSEKEEYKRRKSFWYKRYIAKLKYLEQNYRKTNVYTEYHRQLENPPTQNPVLPPNIPVATATPVQIQEADIMPTAPPLLD